MRTATPGHSSGRAPESCSPHFLLVAGLAVGTGSRNGWCQAPAAGAGVSEPAPRRRQQLQQSADIDLDPSRSNAQFRSPVGRPARAQHLLRGRSRRSARSRLPAILPQAEGAPLTAENLKSSLRQLYATGLYDTIEVRGTRHGDGVALVFAEPRDLHRDGGRGRSHWRHHEYAVAARQPAGGRNAPDPGQDDPRRSQQMRATLEENGYHESTITQTVTAASPRNSLPTFRFAWSRGRVRASARSR